MNGRGRPRNDSVVLHGDLLFPRRHDRRYNQRNNAALFDGQTNRPNISGCGTGSMALGFSSYHPPSLGDKLPPSFCILLFVFSLLKMFQYRDTSPDPWAVTAMISFQRKASTHLHHIADPNRLFVETVLGSREKCMKKPETGGGHSGGLKMMTGEATGLTPVCCQDHQFS